MGYGVPITWCAYYMECLLHGVSLKIAFKQQTTINMKNQCASMTIQQPICKKNRRLLGRGFLRKGLVFDAAGLAVKPKKKPRSHRLSWH